MNLLLFKSLDYKLLKTFRCHCYASILKGNRDKFDHIVDACSFLGYPHGQKGYKLLNITTRKVLFLEKCNSLSISFLFPFNSLPCNLFFRTPVLLLLMILCLPLHILYHPQPRLAILFLFLTLLSNLMPSFYFLSS